MEHLGSACREDPVCTHIVLNGYGNTCEVSRKLAGSYLLIDDLGIGDSILFSNSNIRVELAVESLDSIKISSGSFF